MLNLICALVFMLIPDQLKRMLALSHYVSLVYVPMFVFCFFLNLDSGQQNQSVCKIPSLLTLNHKCKTQDNKSPLD